MKITKITPDEITFDDGSVLISHHDQDCCERVYADFENMQIATDIGRNSIKSEELDFFENVLESIVPIYGLGFYLVSKQGYCIMVSCYDEQKGYYSSELELIHRQNGKIHQKDISRCTFTIRED